LHTLVFRTPSTFPVSPSCIPSIREFWNQIHIYSETSPKGFWLFSLPYSDHSISLTLKKGWSVS
jgi:hypothetical protein